MKKNFYLSSPGHLCFDAIFETGNLGRVDFISEYEYDLFVRPDTCNPRYRSAKTSNNINFSLQNILQVLV